MNWELITSTLTILAASSGLIVYLAKTFSAHLLTRDVERFRADLKASHDTAIEHLRADLRIQAFERETTFSRLHDKRVQVIEELYKRISVVSLAMNRLMTQTQMKEGPSPQEQAQTAADAADAFLEYYLQNQIYFDEALCDRLQAFNEKMYGAWIDFGISKLLVDSPSDSTERWQIAWQAISEDLPKFRKEIEHSFRSLLGQKTL